MNYVVHCEDWRQGDVFIVGPFTSQAAAYVWASRDADEKAESFYMRSGLDADGEGYITLLDNNNDPVYEWSVVLLTPPV